MIYLHKTTVNLSQTKASETTNGQHHNDGLVQD